MGNQLNFVQGIASYYLLNPSDLPTCADCEALRLIQNFLYYGTIKNITGFADFTSL